LQRETLSHTANSHRATKTFRQPSQLLEKSLTRLTSKDNHLLKLQELQTSFLDQFIPFEVSIDGESRLLQCQVDVAENIEEGKTAGNTIQRRKASEDLAV